MRRQAAATVVDLFRDDARVAVVLAEISVPYFAEAFRHDPQRAVNVGIMEPAMVGVAAGFAMEGFHPVASTMASFMAERAYEQLKLDIGYQGLGGTFIATGGAYDYSTEGATHQAPADIALIGGIPGFQVLVPGHPREVDSLVRATYANGAPTYIRLSAQHNADAHPVGVGAAEVLRRGPAATVVAVGPMLDRTLAATDGLDVSVVYTASVEPFDAEVVAATVGDDPVVITVEPCYEGTLARHVAAALTHVPHRHLSIGVPRRFWRSYGEPLDLDAGLGLDAPGIRDRVLAALG